MEWVGWLGDVIAGASADRSTDDVTEKQASIPDLPWSSPGTLKQRGPRKRYYCSGKASSVDNEPPPLLHVHSTVDALDGLFERLQDDFGGFPAYRNARSGHYLYHLQEQWMISQVVGSTVASWSRRSNVRNPLFVKLSLGSGEEQRGKLEPIERIDVPQLPESRFNPDANPSGSSYANFRDQSAAFAPQRNLGLSENFRLDSSQRRYVPAADTALSAANRYEPSLASLESADMEAPRAFDRDLDAVLAYAEVRKNVNSEATTQGETKIEGRPEEQSGGAAMGDFPDEETKKKKSSLPKRRPPPTIPDWQPSIARAVGPMAFFYEAASKETSHFKRSDSGRSTPTGRRKNSSDKKSAPGKKTAKGGAAEVEDCGNCSPARNACSEAKLHSSVLAREGSPENAPTRERNKGPGPAKRNDDAAKKVAPKKTVEVEKKNEPALAKHFHDMVRPMLFQEESASSVALLAPDSDAALGSPRSPGSVDSVSEVGPYTKEVPGSRGAARARKEQARKEWATPGGSAGSADGGSSKLSRLRDTFQKDYLETRLYYEEEPERRDSRRSSSRDSRRRRNSRRRSSSQRRRRNRGRRRKDSRRSDSRADSRQDNREGAHRGPLQDPDSPAGVTALSDDSRAEQPTRPRRADTFLGPNALAPEDQGDDLPIEAGQDAQFNLLQVPSAELKNHFSFDLSEEGVIASLYMRLYEAEHAGSFDGIAITQSALDFAYALCHLDELGPSLSPKQCQLFSTLLIDCLRAFPQYPELVHYGVGALLVIYQQSPSYEQMSKALFQEFATLLQFHRNPLFLQAFALVMSPLVSLGELNDRRGLVDDPTPDMTTNTDEKNLMRLGEEDRLFGEEHDLEVPLQARQAFFPMRDSSSQYTHVIDFVLEHVLDVKADTKTMEFGITILYVGQYFEYRLEEQLNFCIRILDQNLAQTPLLLKALVCLQLILSHLYKNRQTIALALWLAPREDIFSLTTENNSAQQGEKANFELPAGSWLPPVLSGGGPAFEVNEEDRCRGGGPPVLYSAPAGNNADAKKTVMLKRNLVALLLPTLDLYPDYRKLQGACLYCLDSAVALAPVPYTSEVVQHALPSVIQSHLKHANSYSVQFHFLNILQNISKTSVMKLSEHCLLACMRIVTAQAALLDSGTPRESNRRCVKLILKAVKTALLMQEAGLRIHESFLENGRQEFVDFVLSGELLMMKVLKNFLAAAALKKTTPDNAETKRIDVLEMLNIGTEFDALSLTLRMFLEMQLHLLLCYPYVFLRQSGVLGIPLRFLSTLTQEPEYCQEAVRSLPELMFLSVRLIHFSLYFHGGAQLELVTQFSKVDGGEILHSLLLAILSIESVVIPAKFPLATDVIQILANFSVLNSPEFVKVVTPKRLKSLVKKIEQHPLELQLCAQFARLQGQAVYQAFVNSQKRNPVVERDKFAQFQLDSHYVLGTKNFFETVFQREPKMTKILQALVNEEPMEKVTQLRLGPLVDETNFILYDRLEGEARALMAGLEQVSFELTRRNFSKGNMKGPDEVEAGLFLKTLGGFLNRAGQAGVPGNPGDLHRELPWRNRIPLEQLPSMNENAATLGKVWEALGMQGAKSAGIDPVDLQTDIQELHRKLDWLAEALVAGGDSDTARKKKLPDEPVTV